VIAAFKPTERMEVKKKMAVYVGIDVHKKYEVKRLIVL
jgi:hypothetical protein